jgi:hypothetical protein
MSFGRVVVWAGCGLGGLSFGRADFGRDVGSPAFHFIIENIGARLLGGPT